MSNTPVTPEHADHDRDASYRSRPMLDHNFHILWAAQSVSVLGGSLLIVALPWEAYSITHSTSATAFVLAAQIAPFPILGLVSGVMADRWNRRVIMMMSDLIRAIIGCMLALAIALSLLRLWMLVLGTVLLGAFAAIFDAAYAAITPQIVDRGSLNSANARLEASNAAAYVVGPSAAGVIIAAIGIALAFGLDGITYIVGAAGSLLLRYRPASASQRTAGWHDAVHMAFEGVSYLARSRLLRGLTAAGAALAVSNGALDGMLVPLLHGQLNYSNVTVGVVFSAGALGWLTASAVVSRLKPTDHLKFSSLAAIAIAIIGGIGIGLGRIPVISAIALFIFQGGIFYFLITIVTLRQRVVAPDILGRIHALVRSLANVGTPVGAALGGVLAGALPASTITAILCSVPLAISLCLAWFATRKV